MFFLYVSLNEVVVVRHSLGSAIKSRGGRSRYTGGRTVHVFFWFCGIHLANYIMYMYSIQGGVIYQFHTCAEGGGEVFQSYSAWCWCCAGHWCDDGSVICCGEMALGPLYTDGLLESHTRGHGEDHGANIGGCCLGVRLVVVLDGFFEVWTRGTGLATPTT